MNVVEDRAELANLLGTRCGEIDALRRILDDVVQPRGGASARGARRWRLPRTTLSALEPSANCAAFTSGAKTLRPRMPTGRGKPSTSMTVGRMSTFITGRPEVTWPPGGTCTINGVCSTS